MYGDGAGHRAAWHVVPIGNHDAQIGVLCDKSDGTHDIDVDEVVGRTAVEEGHHAMAVEEDEDLHGVPRADAGDGVQ